MNLHFIKNNKMKKYNKYFVLLFALLLVISCQKDDYAFGDINAPANLKVTAEIVGKTTTAPNGDGSGVVKLVLLPEIMPFHTNMYSLTALQKMHQVAF
jgi:hypothetical protein